MSFDVVPNMTIFKLVSGKHSAGGNFKGQTIVTSI